MAGRRPVHEGLFRMDPPCLLGSRCPECGAHHFPPAEVCPYCAADGSVPAELSTTGRLWAWTAVTAAPPGYRGPVPYGVGVVELPEGIRVVTRLTEADPAVLAEGDAVRLTVVPLHHDGCEGGDGSPGDHGDGAVVVTWAFEPAAEPAAGSAPNPSADPAAGSAPNPSADPAAEPVPEPSADPVPDGDWAGEEIRWPIR